MLEYPQDFVQRVKLLYPEDAKLHLLLDTGDIYVGVLLEEAYKATIAVDIGLNSIMPVTVQVLANDAGERKAVLEEWERICIEQNGVVNTWW